MRSVFSIRFLAAVGAVFALLIGLGAFFDAPFSVTALIPGQEVEVAPIVTIAEGKGPHLEETDEVVVRNIEFVDRIFGPDSKTFEVVDHLANSDVTLAIEGTRALFIPKGTPGEDYCGRLHEPGSQCVVVADLLGEGVIWFALVPLAPDGDGELLARLPAIDVLENRRARLINGWELPYDSVLVRICPPDDNPATQDEFESYQEFRRELGDDFTSIFTIRRDGEQSRLSAVECRVQVPWAERSVEDAHLRFEY